MSSRISAGRSAAVPSPGCSRSIASAPSDATTTLLRMLFFAKRAQGERHVVGVVLDEQDGPVVHGVSGQWCREPRCGARVNRKTAPSPTGALGPDPAAVAADDALHDRQPDAGALEVAGGVQALERLEQLVGVAHVEPGAVVAHEESAVARPAARLRADLDGGVVALAR